MLERVREVRIHEEVRIGDPKRPFVLIAGPCVLEDEKRPLIIGEAIKEISSQLKIPFIFKASYDKANRSSIDSFRGPGCREGLEILQKIKERLEVPLLSDIHTVEEAKEAGEVLDILQIPAFLSRQTDLLLAAGRSKRAVNVKKGQFMAPEDMENVVAKIETTGNQKILLTERGVSFGYHNLVVDMCSLPRMRKTGYPVVFDATHSVQLPSGAGQSSSGESIYIPYLVRAALGVGIDALFLEVHDNPKEARCDGPNMVAIHHLKDLLEEALAIDALVKGR